MGGNKKKPTQSNASKSQDDKNTKKEEIKKSSPSKTPQKQKLSVLIEENQGMKSYWFNEVITIHALARTLGVKISVADNFVKSLENKI